MDSFPQLLKVFLKDSSEPFSLFDASLAGETCLTQAHTSLPRQPESTHAFISSNSCQPKGHVSCRTPYGAHSTSSSAPSCFFPLPSTDVDLKSTPCETPCMLISISEPASWGTQPTTTCKVQSMLSGAHSHMFGSIFFPKGCTSGVLLPLSPVLRQHPQPRVPKHWLSG